MRARNLKKYAQEYTKYTKNMRMGEQRQQISEKYAQKILEINE
jgi:hypothetical protein